MQEIHGCSRISFYVGKNLVTCRSDSVAEPQAQKIKTQSDMCVSMTRAVLCRNHLLSWLGHAIRQKNIKMLSPLPGHTLEESTVDALPLNLPPPRFTSANRAFKKVIVNTGDDTCDVYIVKEESSDLPIRIDPSPLLGFPRASLDTPEKVAAVSEGMVTRFLRWCGEEHMPDDLKTSSNLIPNAMTWFIRHPQIRTNKDIVAILKFAAVDTIVPGDWGTVKSDLTFTNGEDIVLRAIPVFEDIARLGQEKKCYYIALFDHRNLVLVTRRKGNKVGASVAVVTGDRIRGALLQWLLRSFEIADDRIESVM